MVEVENHGTYVPQNIRSSALNAAAKVGKIKKNMRQGYAMLWLATRAPGFMVLYGEDVRIQIGNPLFAFLGDA